MPALTKTQFAEMLARAEQIIDVKHEELSELDAACGDGDHGVTILRTLKAAAGAAKANREEPFADLLKAVAMKVMMCDGGSTSPLIGSYFLGLASEAVADELTAEQTATMFEAGLHRFQLTSKAHEGDKTMLDAMIPATQTLAADLRQFGDGPTAFAAAATSAAQGASRTTEYAAKFGRARTMGERSIGHLDPGAVSISLIFAGFAQAQKEKANG